MSSEQEWNQTKTILHEVEQLFTREDDVRDIVEIKKMANEIQDHQNRNLKDAKEIIKKMTAEVAAKELEILAPARSIHETNLEKYRRDKENVSMNVDKLRDAVDMKREAINKMVSQGLALKEKAADFDSEDDASKSKTEYALRLYSHITNISWDYANCSKSIGDNLPAQIAGVLGNDAKKEFHPFRLDTRTMSSYELADTVWKKIEDGIDA